MKFLMIAFWLPRMRSVLLVSRRPGCARSQHLLEVVRAAGQAGAELGEDQPEALAVGPPHDVVDQVGRDRRGGLVDRDRAAVLELPRDEPGWQSTKYSPISDCWRISQLASLRNASKPGSVIFDLDLGLRRRRPSS